MRSGSVSHSSDGVDDGNGIIVGGSNSPNHRSTHPPLSKVVSVVRIFGHNRSGRRVCETDREVLSSTVVTAALMSLGGEEVTTLLLPIRLIMAST
jgi:hypothetical protein